mmetsp:Transcript_2513/g.8318  ORF Transcript_2513/g.8318 Transcript_2513/m.8318 type:complete len:228 (-) Transcript_2513:296-979(-)
MLLPLRLSRPAERRRIRRGGGRGPPGLLRRAPPQQGGLRAHLPGGARHSRHPPHAQARARLRHGPAQLRQGGGRGGRHRGLHHGVPPDRRGPRHRALHPVPPPLERVRELLGGHLQPLALGGLHQRLGAAGRGPRQRAGVLRAPRKLGGEACGSPRAGDTRQGLARGQRGPHYWPWHGNGASARLRPDHQPRVPKRMRAPNYVDIYLLAASEWLCVCCVYVRPPCAQ